VSLVVIVLLTLFAALRLMRRGGRWRRAFCPRQER
jgi:hypothetical protein